MSKQNINDSDKSDQTGKAEKSSQPIKEPSTGNAAVNIKDFGTSNLPNLAEDSNIHCMTIIGQIEGHMILPPQNKTTKN